jgi:hypothetical protein
MTPILSPAFRRLSSFPLLAAALFLASSKPAAAQVYFGGYGATALPYYPITSGYYVITPSAPRARQDHRIDPRLLRAARIASANALPHSRLRCWQYVKDALLQAGAVDTRPTTNYACEAGSELTSRYGFVRLPIHNPYLAPEGAVLVYEGGGAGHVEIRTEHGFASDYRSPWRCRYRLIGVYAKILNS